MVSFSIFPTLKIIILSLDFCSWVMISTCFLFILLGFGWTFVIICWCPSKFPPLLLDVIWLDLHTWFTDVRGLDMVLQTPQILFVFLYLFYLHSSDWIIINDIFSKLLTPYFAISNLLSSCGVFLKFSGIELFSFRIFWYIIEI